MKEDLKNVIITFGLVAFVFTGGFFTYKQKNIQENISILAEELQKVKDENLKKSLENSSLQEELSIVKNIQDQKSRDQALKQAESELARKQATALQQQQAQAKAQAQILLQQQQAQAQAQAAAQAQTSTPVVKPSRKSSAS